MYPFDYFRQIQEIKSENKELRRAISECYYKIRYADRFYLAKTVLWWERDTKVQITSITKSLNRMAQFYHDVARYSERVKFREERADNIIIGRMQEHDRMQAKIDELTSYIAKMQKEYVEVDELLEDKK